MAVEFGHASGVVFLDNVIEDLVGDIQDEFDNDRSAFTRINPDEFVTAGTTTLNELADYDEDLYLESGEVTTVGGYITQQLGRFPEVGEAITIRGHEAKVTSTDGRRRRFFGLAGSQVPQRLPRVGTPLEPPQPRTVTRMRRAPWETTGRSWRWWRRRTRRCRRP